MRYVDFKVYDPVYVALEKGFFQAEGVEVSLYGTVLGGPTAIQAVASGKAEGGLSSIMAIINANAAGLPIQGVVDIQSAIGKQPLEEYFVLESSKLTKLADLKTAKARWAVNLWKSSFHYTALMAMEQASIPKENVEFSLVSFAQQLPALLSGQVDIAGLMEPYASQLKAQGKVRVLFNALDVFGEKQFCTIFLNRVWAEAHPAEARGFTTAVAKACVWIEANQQEAKGIIAKYTGVDVKYVPEYHFQKNGAVVMADGKYWIDYMTRVQDLTVGWVTPEDIGTNAYNGLLK